MLNVKPLALSVLSLVIQIAGSEYLMASESVQLKSHRAVYELTLKGTAAKSSLTSVQGRLVYQFVGSDCEGYSTQSRFLTRMGQESGAERLADIRATTFEDGNGGRFEFLNEQYEGNALVNQSKGVASRNAGGVSVDLARPKRLSQVMSGGHLFPAQHMIRVITAARAGQPLFEVGFYDGTADGVTSYMTSVVIGRERLPDAAPAPADGPDLSALAGSRAWPITISFFKEGGARAEDVPDYQFSALFHDNGVSRDLVFDYGDYALSGRLTEFQMLDQPPCSR